MSNLANGRVNLKFNNSVLEQGSFSSLYSNLILNLYVVYELKNWPHNPTNIYTLKNCSFGAVRNSEKYNVISEKYNEE